MSNLSLRLPVVALTGAVMAVLLYAAVALATPAHAARPGLDGPNCRVDGSGNTLCSTTLPKNGPAAELLHWEWTSCAASNRASGNISDPSKGYVLASTFSGPGTLMVQVFARNGHELYSARAGTPCG